MAITNSCAMGRDIVRSINRNKQHANSPGDRPTDRRNQNSYFRYQIHTPIYENILFRCIVAYITNNEGDSVASIRRVRTMD